jgi:hypothetical protein
MREVRICIDARLMSGSLGGIEQLAVGLARGLSNLRDGDEEYRFMVYAGAGDWIRHHIQEPCSLVERETPRGSVAPFVGEQNCGRRCPQRTKFGIS